MLAGYLLLWAVIGGGVGMLIGRVKGRAAAGFWLGLFLGGVGWIIAAVMARSAEEDARHHIAVAVATQRITGSAMMPPPPSMSYAPAARQALPSAQSKRATDTALQQVRSLGNTDPNPGDVLGGIDRFAADKRPQRSLSDWFFAGGAFHFVCRYDGTLYACNQRMLRTLGTSAAPARATYTTAEDGTIATATIDGVVLEAPHPQLNAKRILDSLRATRVEAPPRVAELPAPQPASLTTDPPPPPPTAPAEAIRTLRTLLDDGLIDQDEFDRKRREIIDRI